MKLKQFTLPLLVWVILISSSCSKKLPVANFSTEKTNYVPGELIKFMNISENADSYIWDFGDGETSQLTSPNHSYDEPGTYKVQLTATNDVGDHTTSQEIEVAYLSGLSLQEMVDYYLEDKDIPGVSIAVYNNDLNQISTATAGFASDGIPVTEDMLFGGNVNSILTSVLCLKLAEEGIINLDDPIGNYTDSINYVNQDITFRQLMFCQGGLYTLFSNDDYAPAITANPSKVWSAADIFSFMKEPISEPGTVAFNESEYIILAYVLEQCSGKSYTELLHEYITVPLGLNSVVMPAFESYDKTKVAPGGFNHSSQVSAAVFSAGVGFTGSLQTASDMATFFNKIYNSDFLSESSKAVLKTKLEWNDELMMSAGAFYYPYYDDYYMECHWFGYGTILLFEISSGNSLAMAVNTWGWDADIFSPLLDNLAVYLENN